MRLVVWQCGQTMCRALFMGPLLRKTWRRPERFQGPSLRLGQPGSALQDLEQAVEAALIDGHHGLGADRRLGVVGHRQPGLAHHG